MTQRLVSRRTALKAFGASAGAAAVLPWLSDEALAAFVQIQKTQAPPVLKILTPAQYATVEALAEAILPADERSPGAKEARVADYVDLLLSEADPSVSRQWVEGLGVLDTEASTRYGAPFVKLPAAQVEELLTEASRNEKLAEPETVDRAAGETRGERPTDVPPAEKPADATATQLAAQTQRTPLQSFFVLAKQATIHGYYTSEIGIHKELRYKGNKVLLEFVGCLTQEGRDCPHCGQKAEG